MIFIALTFCLAGRRFIYPPTPVSHSESPCTLSAIHIYGWATLCRIFHSIVLVFISFICHFCLYSPVLFVVLLLFLLHFYVCFFFFRGGCLQLLNGLSYCGNFLYAPTRFDGILFAGYFEYTNTLTVPSPHSKPPRNSSLWKYVKYIFAGYRNEDLLHFIQPFVRQ